MRVISAVLFATCAGGGPTDSDLDTDTRPEVGQCSVMRTNAAAPTSEQELAELFDEVRDALFPEMADISITLVELDSETDFFQSSLHLSTASDPPRERSYRLLFNPVLFDDPPSQPAIAAILAHELTHTGDYLDMDTAELVEFGIWYATGDTAEYERETDEGALWLGCGQGLIEYREWLYAHIPADAIAEKQRVYYTPDEIRSWMDEHGTAR